jgi:hypothetical protein
MKCVLSAFLFLLSSSGSIFAALPFDCNRGIPLQSAINFALPGETLILTGACAGPIAVSKPFTLKSNSGATIDGNRKDAITIRGPVAVTLNGLSIQHGNNGVFAVSGAQLTIKNTTIHNNALNGVLLESNSSADLSRATTSHNGNNGLDAEASSSVVVSGPYSSRSNGVFGINVNASSSITFLDANVLVSGNTLGIQVGTGASAFLTGSKAVIVVKDNVSTGLTIVSGSHMVAFGGTIEASGNGIHGISVDSKAGLDLDAAANVTSSGNKQDGVHLEETSVLTMFNTPAFSGAPGVTTLTTTDNGANGISVLTGSNLTVIHQASIISSANSGSGVLADNGSSITLIQSKLTGNTRDVTLTFGSRGDITTSQVGTLACDASVLLRGDTGRTCPGS